MKFAARLIVTSLFVSIFIGVLTGLLFRARVQEVIASEFMNLPIKMQSHLQWALFYAFLSAILLVPSAMFVVGGAAAFSRSSLQGIESRRAPFLGLFAVTAAICGLLSGLFASHSTPPTLMDLLCGALFSSLLSVGSTIVLWRWIWKMDYGAWMLMLIAAGLLTALGLVGWLSLWDSRLARKRYYRPRRVELQLQPPKAMLERLG